uniref:Uncharacterized protein n=1 Tax=Spongospora subterranea TaxID=70186 RepID=A0A0H5R2F3_9EUKA|eukprot:CRZ08141.1 hypothetical protein [Spongospora subterranea]
MVSLDIGDNACDDTKCRSSSDLQTCLFTLRAETVNFRNIECYVTDEDMETVLMGKLFEAPNNRRDVEETSSTTATEASKLQLHRFVVQDDPGDADAFKEYWQFPLHPDSHEFCFFMTHEVVFTPRQKYSGHN